MTRSIDLQGHRGARGLFPENTLAGFAGALAIGVDTLELDVTMTADDVVVVTHDPTLNPDITRTSDGAWLAQRGPSIRSLRIAKLASFDVGRIRPGSAYAALYPDQSPCDGARIPTLAQVLRLDPAVAFNIELKTFPWDRDPAVDGARMAVASVAVADELGVAGRIIVQSFDWRGPRHLRLTRLDIRLAWLTRSDILAQAALWWDGPAPSDYGGSVPRAVAAEGGPIWGPNHRDLTEEPGRGPWARPPGRALDRQLSPGHAQADPLGCRWADFRPSGPGKDGNVRGGPAAPPRPDRSHGGLRKFAVADAWASRA
jgi:glycerophosphoryl diester phosphodiesterase